MPEKSEMHKTSLVLCYRPLDDRFLFDEVIETADLHFYPIASVIVQHIVACIVAGSFGNVEKVSLRCRHISIITSAFNHGC